MTKKNSYMVQVGCGKMSKEDYQVCHGKKNIEIVGAVDNRPEAIGQDLGLYLDMTKL